jgi:hypothetical protein
MESSEAVDRRLEAFADEIEMRLGESASVRREVHSPTWKGVYITPLREGSADVSWFYTRRLQVDIGSTRGGGRFEIDSYDLIDADFIQELVESTIAGRVVERFTGDGWSAVEVTLADGTVVRESGGSSLPWPWKRRRTVEYLPYVEGQ